MIDARGFYDGLGPDYDRMVSWDARLTREDAFFSRLFESEGTRSVLDAACGTGMHVISFARAGLHAAGADMSPVMIEHARRNADRAGVPADFHVAGFGGIHAILAGPFDAITCIGNSLPHLLTDADLAGCLTDFHSLLRPGGLLAIQNRNYDMLLRERRRVAPVAARGSGDDETLFLRITDYAPPGAVPDDAITFTLVTLKRAGGSWVQSVQSTPMRALRSAVLADALRAAGFPEPRLYGSYDLAPADAAGAQDLIVLARSAAAF